MDVKEKLVELIGSTEYGNGSLVGKNFQKGFIEKIASNIIANGVTVQEWISVKDRLPEEWHTVLVFVPSIDAIIPAKLRGGFWYSNWDTTRLDNVSYWMPMPEKPQPQKGE